MPDKIAAGVTVRERVHVGLAIVIARKGQRAALAQRLHERLGIELPSGPHRTVAGGGLSIAGIGRHTWLASSEQSIYGLEILLREAISDAASVFDQSDGYTVARLCGPNVRDVLCKLVPVDLDTRFFKPGDVAVTAASHIAATLWRLEDQADGAAAFEIAVPRSFTASFWHALSESAAEFGFQALQT